jgi:hypothetical protein
MHDINWRQSVSILVIDLLLLSIHILRTYLHIYSRTQTHNDISCDHNPKKEKIFGFTFVFSTQNAHSGHFLKLDFLTYDRNRLSCSLIRITKNYFTVIF